MHRRINKGISEVLSKIMPPSMKNHGIHHHAHILPVEASISGSRVEVGSSNNRHAADHASYQRQHHCNFFHHHLPFCLLNKHHCLSSRSQSVTIIQGLEQ